MVSAEAAPRGLRPPFIEAGRVLVAAHAGAVLPGLRDLLAARFPVEIVDPAPEPQVPFPFHVVTDAGTSAVVVGADADAPAPLRHLPLTRVPRALSPHHVVSDGERRFIAEAGVVDATGGGDAQGGALRAFVDAVALDAARAVRLPGLPGDADAAVDACVLPVARGHAVVPEIDEAAFECVRLAHEVGLGRLVQTFLDVQAARIAAAGVTVERLPVMPPFHLVRAAARPEGWTGVFLTPTQAIVVVGRGRRAVVLPRHLSEEFPLRYRGLVAMHLARWSSYFEARGFEVLTVDVELLVRQFKPICRFALPVP